MITPRFSLDQDGKTVTFKIRAPYCNLRELELSIEDDVFIFICKPYYLRLHLPGHLNECSVYNKSSFDVDTGEFTFIYAKAIAGEFFPDLDLVTKLLPQKIVVNEGERKIEVLTETCQASEDDLEKRHKDADLQFGFAMRGHYDFCYDSSEFSEIFEINPNEVPLQERRKLRLLKEESKFDKDHYICDMIDNDQIQEYMHLTSPWEKEACSTEFTPSELDFLKDLPNIQYNLSPVQVQYCHNGLLEILFAYCYDRRITDFEGNCESGWTISKLCAGLSWFDGFTNPRETIVSSYRRSLIYPLYRHFDLNEKVFCDVKDILRLGEKMIIKSLIEIHNIFLNGDRYILNNLFIKDYIVYIMKWDNNLWKETVNAVNGIRIAKSDLGLQLANLERGFWVNSNETDLCDKIGKLDIADSRDSNDSQTSDSDDTENESEKDSEESSDSDSDAVESTSVNAKHNKNDC